MEPRYSLVHRLGEEQTLLSNPAGPQGPARSGNASADIFQYVFLLAFGMAASALKPETTQLNAVMSQSPWVKHVLGVTAVTAAYSWSDAQGSLLRSFLAGSAAYFWFQAISGLPIKQFLIVCSLLGVGVLSSKLSGAGQGAPPAFVNGQIVPAVSDCSPESEAHTLQALHRHSQEQEQVLTQEQLARLPRAASTPQMWLQTAAVAAAMVASASFLLRQQLRAAHPTHGASRQQT